MVGMGEGQTKAKASKKGEGGSAGSPLPVVCWLQEEGSFLGLSVLLPRLPHPQVPAPLQGKDPWASGLSFETQYPRLWNDEPPWCGVWKESR